MRGSRPMPVRPVAGAMASALVLAGVLSGCSFVDSSVNVDGWTATCVGVDVDACKGVTHLFVNNLARSSESVRNASGAGVVVESRLFCPETSESWADPSGCWQVMATTPDGPVCMIVARHRSAVEGAASTYGQIGGMDYTGRLAAPGAPTMPPCD
jgi:hypothetical protein